MNDARFPVAFPLLVVALVLGGSFVVARVSGWATLARRFRQELPFTGAKWGWQSARMRFAMGYNNCLTVGADANGLYLSTMFLFRIGHPPLLLPWHEVSLREQGKMLFVRYVELSLGREEQIPFRINGRLAERLQFAAGQSWPVGAG